MPTHTTFVLKEVNGKVPVEISPVRLTRNIPTCTGIAWQTGVFALGIETD